MGDSYRRRLALAYHLLLLCRNHFVQLGLWRSLVGKEERYPGCICCLGICAYSRGNVFGIFGNTEELMSSVYMQSRLNPVVIQEAGSWHPSVVVERLGEQTIPGAED